MKFETKAKGSNGQAVSALHKRTRRTGLSVNPQCITCQPRNSVQTTEATANLSRLGNATLIDEAIG
jgi:hypothetical protein